jgi:DNA invertase Pin-like site-specific DNA recombinase
MKVVAYVRVSTDEQKLGPQAQRAAIEAWAQREGHIIVAAEADLGVSGGAELDRRPGLLAAVGALEAGDLLVAQKRDRIARDAILAGLIERMVERKGAKVVTVEGPQGDDPSDILMRRIVDAFAEYERLLIKARTKAALAVKKSRGERVGQIPYGWALGHNNKLVEEAYEQAVIERIHEMAAQGLSQRAIARKLDHSATQARGTTWNHKLIGRILKAQPA